MIKKLLAKLRHKWKVYKRWKLGQVPRKAIETLSEHSGMELGK